MEHKLKTEIMIKKLERIITQLRRSTLLEYSMHEELETKDYNSDANNGIRDGVYTGVRIVELQMRFNG